MGMAALAAKNLCIGLSKKAGHGGRFRTEKENNLY